MLGVGDPDLGKCGLLYIIEDGPLNKLLSLIDLKIGVGFYFENSIVGHQVIFFDPFHSFGTVADLMKEYTIEVRKLKQEYLEFEGLIRSTILNVDAERFLLDFVAGESVIDKIVSVVYVEEQDLFEDRIRISVGKGDSQGDSLADSLAEFIELLGRQIESGEIQKSYLKKMEQKRLGMVKEIGKIREMVHGLVRDKELDLKGLVSIVNDMSEEKIELNFPSSYVINNFNDSGLEIELPSPNNDSITFPTILPKQVIRISTNGSDLKRIPTPTLILMLKALDSDGYIELRGMITDELARR